MDAYLILEDGTVFQGSSAGAQKEVISEIVFNTSMTGYQEVLTDPSYAGQAVTMTYPLIGNYGVNRRDMESERAWPDAFIVRELAQMPGSWRSENTLQNFLKGQGVAGIEGIDTRALTRRLRDAGTMNGCITTKHYRGPELQALLGRIREYKVTGAVERTTSPLRMEYDADKVPCGEGNGRSFPCRRKRVALLDVGCKKSIIRGLLKEGCDVTVFPSHTPASDILAMRPDGILISNGPGDPKDNPGVIRQIRILADSGVPVFAICLGHQLMALAMGADTYKLKYGHRGGNHPVKDLATGRVYITSQNHGYAVDPDSMDPAVAREAFRNVNDGTNEGWMYTGRPILTVQYHPEASPGPRDSGYLFGRFMEMMDHDAAGGSVVGQNKQKRS